MGTGAIPDVMLARAAGLELGGSGGVAVDARLQTSAPGIYAAGDVAEYESVVHGGRRLRIEHWDVALQSGQDRGAQHARLRSAARRRALLLLRHSDWASLEYVGPAWTWDEEVVRGSIDDGEFSIFYLHEGRVAGALSVGRPDDLEHARRLLSHRRCGPGPRRRARRPVDRSRVDLVELAAIVGPRRSGPMAQPARAGVADWCNWQHG